MSAVMPSLMPASIEGEIVKVEAASKRYGGVVALDRVDFSVGRGEVRALLGKNGAGKSTLIRLLTGAERADAGKVLLLTMRGLVERGSVDIGAADSFGVRCVYQELSLVPEMSIAENMFLGGWPKKWGVIDHETMAERARSVLQDMGLELDPSQTIAMLSPAERQLVEIARATMGEPQLVILDEPTSSLDLDKVDRVFAVVRRLKNKGSSVIYVSHRMDEIREIADSATIMRDGKAVSTLPVKSVDTHDIIKMMLGEEGEHTPISVRAKTSQTPKHYDHPVLELHHITAPPHLNDISFALNRGEVLGIAGLLGSGRTELLRLIAGLDQPQSGDLLINGKNVARLGWHHRMRLGLGFTPENRKDEGIIPLLGVDENIIISGSQHVSRVGILSAKKIHHASQNIIDRMHVKVGHPSQPIHTLSGGNQQKIVMGRWVLAEAQILLLDEPTRGIDIEAKKQIYAIIRDLAQAGKSVIFVSSEIEELPQVCDRVLVLKDGKIKAQYHAPNIEASELLAASMAGIVSAHADEQEYM